MGEWKKVKLGDCIEEVVEKTTENNQHQVLSVTKDGIFSQEEFFKKQIASENNIGYKVIRKNNLVFSTMNLWMGSLDVLTNYDIGIVSPAYKIFKFNEELMLPSYGNYFMKSYYMLEQYKNCSEQGASIVRRNLDLKALLNTNINIPLIAEQEKIVRILEKVDLIIKNYERLLEEKNRFIKSQFVEMFGNQNCNEKKMQYGKIENVADIYLGLTHTPTYVDSGVPFLSVKDISNGKIDFTKCHYITEEEYVKLPKGAKPQKGDILFCRVGTIGKPIIIKDDIPLFGSFVSLGFFRPKHNVISEYLEYWMKDDFFIQQVRNKVSGGSQLNLNTSWLKEFKIIVPPIELQNQFAEIVKQIDKQKFELKRIIENYKSLKKGLMQQLLTRKVDVNV